MAGAMLDFRGPLFQKAGSGESMPADWGGQARRGVWLAWERVSGRSLAVRELPLVALLLALLAASLALPAAVPAAAGAEGALSLIVCPFFYLTGIPCLMCGITRSFIAMGHLDIGQAFIYHPLGPVFYIMAGLLVPATVITALGGRRPRLRVSPRARRTLLFVMVASLVLAWPLKLWLWSQNGIS